MRWEDKAFLIISQETGEDVISLERWYWSSSDFREEIRIRFGDSLKAHCKMDTDERERRKREVERANLERAIDKKNKVEKRVLSNKPDINPLWKIALGLK